jgi:hypothetical protein
MVQGYYTLDESAHILGISPDELKQLARKGEIRSFQDRGTWRFRIQDIQEMARRSGKGSDPELALGEALAPKPTDSPAPRSPKPGKKSDDVFGFSLDAGTDSGANLGGDLGLGGPGSSKKGGSSGKLVPPGSDSDVRLVSDGSDVTFQVPPDSDVKVVQDGPKSSPKGPKSGSKLGGAKSPRPSKVAPDQTLPEPVDSGVRLVPMDSDSDVRIVGAEAEEAGVGTNPPKGATDSDIRLETHTPASPPTGSPEGLLTEEINLDEELKKDEARRDEQLRQAKGRPTGPQFPQTSPFELSESDLELAPVSEQPLPQVKDPDNSSDFDLTPAAESSSPLELGSSDDFKLEVPDDDEVTLADDGKSNLKGPSSGINLNKPADSGISLEQGGSGDEIEFELTLDAESTPKPSKPSTPKPSAAQAVPDSDSEFELSLDVDSPKSDSDSEFELTLDDSGGLAPLEAEAEAAEDKDIFETDFEVPALEEESGSEAVVMEEGETELESSDFELAIDDSDVAAEEDESGSQVLALDDEEAVDDAAETVTAQSRAAKKKARAAAAQAEAEAFADLDEPMAEADEDEDIEELDGDLVEETTQKKVIRQTVVVQQAPWGIFPVLVLLPCLIVMVLLGLMGFELAQTQQGYKPGLLTRTIGGWIDKNK